MTRDAALRALARAHGVMTSYVDVDGARRVADLDVVALVLRALGVIDEDRGATDALEHRRAVVGAPGLPRVVVAWGGRTEFALRLDPGTDESPIEVAILTDDHREQRWRLPVVIGTVEAGRPVARIRLPERLPPGVHRLRARVDGADAWSWVVAAPRRCFGRRVRGWGVMAPVHALRDGPDLGVGHLGLLESLGDWVADRGGSHLATLPLLPTFLDRPFDPSPYAPVSRRHWNEALLDPRGVAAEPDVLADVIVESGPGRLVDWRSVGDRVTNLLGRACDTATDRQRERLQRFRDCHPDVDRYARFRAAIATTGSPPPERGPGPDPRVVDRYVLAQRILREHMASLTSRLRTRGVGLVLDFPLGVHDSGYDRWEAPHEYVSGVSVGAPPDDFFPGGQVWGFAPMRPDAGVDDGFARQLAAYDHHMAPAAALRVDHVMGLHRTYWVPDGVPATDGVYVRSPAEVRWAVLSLASHRNACRVVGEDLGTVPRATRAALARHDVLGLWVGQFELDAKHPIPCPPRRTMASLSTHDTPTFAGWWVDADVRTGLELGFLSARDAEAIVRGRAPLRARLAAETGAPAPEAADVVEMLLAHLGASRAEIVLASLDDLWGEIEPTNVPGTGEAVPNWRRRHAHTLTELREDPSLQRPLAGLARARVTKGRGRTDRGMTDRGMTDRGRKGRP